MRQRPKYLGENSKLQRVVTSTTTTAPMQIACASGSEVDLETTALTTQYVQLPIGQAEKFKISLWYADKFGSTFVIYGNQGKELMRLFGSPAKVDFILLNGEFKF